MMCLKCVHSIVRTIWDGVSENEFIHCELDNILVSVQMRSCSRWKEVEVAEVVYTPPPEIVEPEPVLPPLEPIVPKLWAKIDAKPKKVGWPKGKKRK